MTTLSASNPTLLDVANLIGPDGKAVKAVVELLAETNEVFQDAAWQECNDGTGHKTPVRTGLPTPTWRKLYGGAAEGKGTTVQIRDACGMLEQYSTIDASLVPLLGQSEWRMLEEIPFIESMNQALADALFYGDSSTTPEKIMGIAPRFDSLSAENAGNIISGGSNDTDNTSIYLVCWHPLTCSMLYPKGSQAGLRIKDLGEQTVLDGSNNPFQALRTHYKWDVGVCVRDWRYVVRIANIEVSDLVKDASSGADLVDLMVQALEVLPGNSGMGRKSFYGNRTIRSYLRRQIKNKANLALSLDQVAGKQVLSFDGIPVRRCDAITNAEALVS